MCTVQSLLLRGKLRLLVFGPTQELREFLLMSKTVICQVTQGYHFYTLSLSVHASPLCQSNPLEPAKH